MIHNEKYNNLEEQKAHQNAAKIWYNTWILSLSIMRETV